jgi:hemoglobin
MTFVTATSRADNNSANEAMIEGLVRRFYSRVRADAELGPIFASVIGDDWEPHLRIMMDFWSSLMLRTGRYSGQPLRKHLPLKQVRPEHFDRWLELFRESCAEIEDARVRPAFIDKAERIAESFKLGMFFHPSQVAPR